jgi:hypothetical protein
MNPPFTENNMAKTYIIMSALCDVYFYIQVKKFHCKFLNSPVLIADNCELIT